MFSASARSVASAVLRPRGHLPPPRFFSSTRSTQGQTLSDGDLKPIRDSFDIRGRNFIVTGGGRGIGYGAVRAIAEMGGNVSILDWSPKPVADFDQLSELGVETKYIQTDVTDAKSLTEGFEKAMSDFEHLDGLVTAAGIVVDGPFPNQSWEDVRRIMNVNILGTFFAAQLATKRMLQDKTKGSIVLIASVSGSFTTPGHDLSSYNASKGAVKMLGTALGAELGPAGIRVNSISPGYIDTEMLTPLKAAHPERVELMAATPRLRRIGNRNDLTPAILYLLSDASSYTTGAELMITGGLHCGTMTTEP